MPLTQEELSFTETESGSDESSELIKRKTSSDTFIVADTLYTETKLMLQRSALMTIQIGAQLGSPVIALIFIGTLPDSALYIAGCGLARTFVNCTGTAMAWGFTTALFTLLTQSIGAGHTNHAAIHIQRSVHVVTIIASVLSIPELFAGDIMVAVGQPEDLRDIINTYSRWFIPYIFLCGLYCFSMYEYTQTNIRQKSECALFVSYIYICIRFSFPSIGSPLSHI